MMRKRAESKIAESSKVKAERKNKAQSKEGLHGVHSMKQ